MNSISAIDRFPGEAPRLAITAITAITAAPAAAASAPAASATPAPVEMPATAVSAAADTSDVRFEVDDATQQVVIRISDPSTGDVVRQIPSEVMLRVAEMIADARGGTVDARA